jgi:hypothetical protein
MVANDVSAMMFFVDPNSMDPEGDLTKQYQSAYAEQYYNRYFLCTKLLLN